MLGGLLLEVFGHGFLPTLDYRPRPSELRPLSARAVETIAAAVILRPGKRLLAQLLGVEIPGEINYAAAAQRLHRWLDSR